MTAWNSNLTIERLPDNDLRHSIPAHNVLHRAADPGGFGCSLFTLIGGNKMSKFTPGPWHIGGNGSSIAPLGAQQNRVWASDGAKATA